MNQIESLMTGAAKALDGVPDSELAVVCDALEDMALGIPMRHGLRFTVGPVTFEIEARSTVKVHPIDAPTDVLTVDAIDAEIVRLLGLHPSSSMKRIYGHMGAKFGGYQRVTERAAKLLADGVLTRNGSGAKTVWALARVESAPDTIADPDSAPDTLRSERAPGGAAAHSTERVEVTE